MLIYDNRRLREQWGSLQVIADRLDDADVLPGAARLKVSDLMGLGGSVRQQLDILLYQHIARLKHCPICEHWFVDVGKSQSAERCSTKCTDRAWPRRRKRAAGHKGL